MLNNAEMLQRARVRHVIFAAVGLVGMSFGASTGCTQDFDQFSPSSSGGSGALGGGGTGMGGSTGGGGGNAECEDNAECDDFNPCTDDTCSASGTCNNDAVANGLAPEYTDLPGDCVENRCEDGVLMTDVADDAEQPEDGNPCTILSCSDGTVQTTNEREGVDCGPNPPSNLACDDMGQCIGCMDPTDCPGTDDFCGTRTCDANMICGTTFTDAMTPLPNGQQTAGDCEQLQCDGAGATVSVNLNSDLPVDANPCTTGVCTNGNPSQMSNPAGSTCPTGVCTGGGSPSCVECVTGAQCTSPETCGGGNPGTPNVCGCTAESNMTTCDPACGPVVNNCGTTVACTCTSPAVCNSGTCCTPETVGMTCGTSCGANMTNNCGQSIPCSCTLPQVCNGGTCCTPEPMGTTCAGLNCGMVNNNCGVAVSCGTCMAPTPTCNNNVCE